MMVQRLSLAAEKEGSTLRLSVAGEFDRAATDRVERALDEALALSTGHIVLDLSAVTFLDLAAIMALLRANTRTRDHALGLTIVRPNGPASRIFTLTRLGEVLALTDRNAGRLGG